MFKIFHFSLSIFKNMFKKSIYCRAIKFKHKINDVATWLKKRKLELNPLLSSQLSSFLLPLHFSSLLSLLPLHNLHQNASCITLLQFCEKHQNIPQNCPNSHNPPIPESKGKGIWSSKMKPRGLTNYLTTCVLNVYNRL